ncbi:hypothetical protein [Laspinema olomoucense]|uniref:hypothetical protein n=1 Tax=Laspinema olomoucense TaxID=3231600 RepID=UPI0021BB509A|nr:MULTISPECIES: hypothetical protein [unclassified Laspinema]MCT7972864.1 hypothetical protein [Laspinema sp. D3d]MCT7991176.1 hypothetical protein [Laspinema sp. D3a]MCT7995598.1 hypothetical protein [Laspinema sp. D3c]
MKKGDRQDEPRAESPWVMVGFKARSHLCRFYCTDRLCRRSLQSIKNPHPIGWGYQDKAREAQAQRENRLQTTGFEMS